MFEEQQVEVRLNRFIALGREIMSEDRAATFGQDFTRIAVRPPSVSVAQPGFIGPDYKGLVILGLNPGSGDSRPSRRGFGSKLEEWNKVLADWRDTGSLRSYEEAFECWLDDLSEWRVWQMYVEPMLGLVQLEPRDIAYLNLFQSPTIANSRPTPRMLSAGWRWTKQQLDILAPKAVVAGGKEVGALLRARWPATNCEVFVQNRDRRLNTVARLDWIRATGAEIAKLLA